MKGIVLGLVFLMSLSGLSRAQEELPMREGAKMEKATFAGGCFWCMEPSFQKLKGVQAVVSGYIGGTVKNPTYEQVSAGRTGHAEAVEVTYDPAQVSYEKLLEIFWENHDPTDAKGQFVDQGSQYRPGIFYHSDDQKRLAEESKKKLSDSRKFNKPIVTEITAATEFYPAEDYHQDYYKKNAMHYKFYRMGSGRDDFLDETWGKGRSH